MLTINPQSSNYKEIETTPHMYHLSQIRGEDDKTQELAEISGNILSACAILGTTLNFCFISV